MDSGKELLYIQRAKNGDGEMKNSMKLLAAITAFILLFEFALNTGQYIEAKHAFDVAERFSTLETLEAGDVVVLSETRIDEKIASEALNLDEKDVKDGMKELNVEEASKLAEVGDNNLNENNKTENKNPDESPKQKIINKLNEKDKEIKTSTGKDRLIAAKAALVKTTNIQNDINIIGVVSSNPSFVMGYGSELKDINSVPVALIGRVPVKVSLENGIISAGDPLTSSTRKGYAAKSINAGRIIGYAMESYNEKSNSEKILVFVQPGMYNANAGTQQLNYLNKVNGSVIIRVG